MGKKINKKAPNKKQKQQSQSYDDYEYSTSTSVKKGRSSMSLELTTQKFIQSIKKAQNKIIDLNQTAQSFKVSKRRIYEICNALQGVDLVKRIGKCYAKWIQGQQSIQLQKDINNLSKRLQALKEQQKNSTNVSLNRITETNTFQYSLQTQKSN